MDVYFLVSSLLFYSCNDMIIKEFNYSCISFQIRYLFKLKLLYQSQKQAKKRKEKIKNQNVNGIISTIKKDSLKYIV